MGARVQARRELLRLSIRGAALNAGLSEGLWRQIESGERMVRKGIVETVHPKPTTTAAVSSVLGWTPDSIERILAGGEPELVVATPPDGELSQLRGDLDKLRGQVTELAEQIGLLLDLANARVAGDAGAPPAASEDAR